MGKSASWGPVGVSERRPGLRLYSKPLLESPDSSLKTSEVRDSWAKGKTMVERALTDPDPVTSEH